MKSSCSRLMMAALVLGSSIAVEAQSVAVGPEVLVSLEGFESIYTPPPALAVGPDGGSMGSWVSGTALKARGLSPADDLRGAVQTLASVPARAQLASLGPDRFVAVWGAGQVVARFLDAAGAPLGEAFPLAATGVLPAVAAEPSGGFVVVWQQDLGLLARHFDALGHPVGGEIELGFGLWPSVAALPGGGFAVAWYGAGGTYVRSFFADGTPANPAVRLDSLDAEAQPPARVSADAAGRFVTAWAERAELAEAHDRVQARRFDPSGLPLGPATLVTETGQDHTAALGDIAVRPEGSFLVTWEEASSVRGGPAHVPPDIFPIGGNVLARAFDASGLPLGPAALVHDGEVGEQHPGEAEATSDGWLVSWWRRLDRKAGVYLRRYTLSCGTGTELCLHGGRFRAEVRWRTSPTGPEGKARPLALTRDTGGFWFFTPTNAELVVKVLDGTSLNGHFWVFYGSLTDVAFDLTITDTLTGWQRTYHNPAGTMASQADTRAFPSARTGAAAAAVAPEADPHLEAAASTAACGGGILCLQGNRFYATVDWHVPATGARGRGTASPLTRESGTFWFFEPTNVELIVKVLDGRGINGHWWVFYGSLTDIEFELTVTDTETAEQRTYRNPAGTMASRADTEAF